MDETVRQENPRLGTVNCCDWPMAEDLGPANNRRVHYQLRTSVSCKPPQVERAGGVSV